MAYFFGGKRLEPGKPFSAGDTMFPENYLDLSTPEEKKALGITEQEDPEPIRMAGEGPASSTKETSPINTNNTTSFPEADLDASTKQFLDSLGQDFFDQFVKPQYAGDRFNIQEGRLNYNKPEHQKGGVIRYARPDKVTPPPTEFLPTTGDTPKVTTPPAPEDTPKVTTPPIFTPPEGTSPSINPPKSTPTESPSSTSNDDSQPDDSRENQAFVHAPSIIEQARTKNPISTGYGINKYYFGGEDLEAAREAGHSDADILKYLDANPNLLREQNVKGGGGLYDQLNPAFHQYKNKPDPIPDYTSNLSEQQTFVNAPEPSAIQGERRPISIEYGISDKYFGGEDLEAAKEAGYSDKEIFDYLNAATNLLRDQNAPGGGGIYDQLKAKVG